MLRLALLIILAGPVMLSAATDTPRRERQALSVLIENDMLFNTDRYYTNGVSLAWTRSQPPSALVARVIDWLGYPRAGLEETHGLELGQIMSTPADTQIAAPQPNDRPWAGLLFFGPTLQLHNDRHLAVFKLFLGFSGPWSLADKTQSEWHRFIGVNTPKGWANQWKTEPEIGLVFERRVRMELLDPAGDWNLEFIPKAGLHLGTVLVRADAGAQVRYGYRLPRDFGSSLISTSGNLPPPRLTGEGARERDRFGVHVFAGVTGSATAHSLFLDGAVFRDSTSVEKRPFTVAVEAGVTITTAAWRVTFTAVDNSRAFENQIANQGYTSLNVTYFW